MAKGLIPLLLACALLAISLPALSADPAGEKDRMLIDYGNGDTEWHDIVPGSTFREALSSSAPSLDVEFSSSGEDTTVASIGGVGDADGRCSWRLYLWNEVVWEVQPMDMDMPYSSGCFALGYYPTDSIAPVSENR